MTRSIYRPPWRIDIDVRDGVEPPVALAALARAVASALDAVQAPAPASIGLILSDDAELAGLNATHMGKTGPTDVLSFPLLPPEAFGARAASRHAGTARRRGRGCTLATSSCPSSARVEQAASGRGGQTGDVRWSAADEVRLLVTHGTLHICGRDHAEPEEEAAMRALERRLLAMP